MLAILQNLEDMTDTIEVPVDKFDECVTEHGHLRVSGVSYRLTRIKLYPEEVNRKGSWAEYRTRSRDGVVRTIKLTLLDGTIIRIWNR